MNSVEIGYRGISFPFRIGVKGGVVMSTTTVDNPAHIVEAMQQILLTSPMERGMEYHFKADIDYDIFEPNDLSTHTLVDYQVKEALRTLEDRIEVLGIKITSEEDENGNEVIILADITFSVLSTGNIYQRRFTLGGIAQ